MIWFILAFVLSFFVWLEENVRDHPALGVLAQIAALLVLILIAALFAFAIFPNCTLWSCH